MQRKASKILTKIMMMVLSANLITGALPVVSYASETDNFIVEDEQMMENGFFEIQDDDKEPVIDFTDGYGSLEDDFFEDSSEMQKEAVDETLNWARSGNDFIPVTSVGISTCPSRLTVGDKAVAVGAVLPTNATNPTIKWSSSDESLATVDQQGNIEAVGAGVVQIIVESTDGTNLSFSKNITIKPVLASSISVDKTSLELNTGDTAALSATVLPENTGNKTVKWSSQDTRVVTVDQNGNVKAEGAGTTKIAAATQDGSYLVAYCDVTVSDIKATSITLDHETLSITEGNTAQMIATILPENTTNKSLKWTTTNGVVVSVTQEGVITARRAGAATITVKTQDGTNLQAKCRVTVVEGTNPVTSVTFDKTNLVMNTGEKATIVATVLPTDAQNTNLNWATSNSSVATVDDFGVVTAKGAGSANITATSKDGTQITATCSVTVNGVKATSLKLNKSTITLYVNGTDTLTAEFEPSNVDSKALTWESANTNVATVNQNGFITGVGKGTTTITATTKDGSNLKAICVVKVDGNMELITMHRLYNRRSGEHFYTSNTYERDVLVKRGWTYEGVAWKAPETTQYPVYRMYSPKSKAHHYTMSANERDTLCGLGKFAGRGKGWNDEGIGWYSAQSAESIQQLPSDEQSKYMPLHRLYNPRYPMVSAHHYTADEHEVSVLLTRGWVYEGIAWYGIR